MKATIRSTVALVAVGLLFSACSKGGAAPPAAPSAQQTGQQQTETAFAAQQTAVPYPADQLKNSLERANLRDRLLRLNDASKIGYVYLLSFTGQPFGFYTIKGKVSSTDSQMTTTDLIQGCPGGQGGNGATSGCGITVPAPGDDGSYGANEAGIFFFTSEGTLVETSVNFLYSDAPLPLDVPKLNAPG